MRSSAPIKYGYERGADEFLASVDDIAVTSKHPLYNMKL